MRVDIVVPNQGATGLEAVRAAARFEDMGYHGLWLTDHVVGIDALVDHLFKFVTHWKVESVRAAKDSWYGFMAE
ncbi:hypothetical protein [Sphingobium lactosutens]|jgi:hypothetical protein|uniref:Luciferase-like domain-containing protein n=1 Tax=Sphingobium lactosutens DS20 TaxID=1331060 RepID=T0HUU9_9SPHN|nr:hypothetical protein [Sphingobium lactosutens]EQB15933.1 hypothetical protein RLDS_09455 [Sphingobium lactosutens DS20]